MEDCVLAGCRKEGRMLEDDRMEEFEKDVHTFLNPWSIRTFLWRTCPCHLFDSLKICSKDE